MTKKTLTPQSNQTSPSQIYGESKTFFCVVTLILSLSVKKIWLHCQYWMLLIWDHLGFIYTGDLRTHFPTEQEATEVTTVVAVSKLWRQDLYFTCLFKWLICFSAVRIFFSGKRMEDKSLILLPPLNPGQSLTWDKLVETHWKQWINVYSQPTWGSVFSYVNTNP